jgi:lipoprotein-releasing system permease protein
VTDVKRAMLNGDLDGLKNGHGGLDGIVLGKDLAAKLRVEVGDEVSLLTAQGTLSPMGMMPRPRRMRVVGTFRLGLLEADSTFGYVSIVTAKRLFDKDQVDHIQLRLDDVIAAPRISEVIQEKLGKDYLKQDWTEMNRSLFSALTLEKIAMSLAIGLIVGVAALNIVTSLVLLVIEKNRDIAILKTMGASAKSVTAIFVLQGLFIGLVGTAVGAVAGLVVCYVFDHYRLISMPMDVYQVSHLPFKVLPLDFTLVVIAAVVVCLLATIYPSRRAAHLDPAEALRYE